MDFKIIKELFTEWGKENELRKAFFETYKALVENVIKYGENDINNMALFIISRIIEALNESGEKDLEKDNNGNNSLANE